MENTFTAVLNQAAKEQFNWEQFMAYTGHEVHSTFYGDFTIAELCGNAEHDIRDTYKRAFNEWKEDIEMFTDLVMCLNHKISAHYEHNTALAKLYDELWREADSYAMDNLKGDDMEYYLKTTD